MNAARLNGLVFATLGVLAVAVAWRSACASHPTAPPPQSAPSTPLSAVPQGAMLVATLDAKKLRESRLGAALLAEKAELPGLGPIVDVCGFDPTLRVEMLTFAIPGVEPHPDDETPIEFGVAGYGDFESASVAACAGASIRHRGGFPVTTSVGSFTSIRQRAGSAGEIAVRDGGPVLLGGGRYLREMIDAADGRIPDASRDERHRAIRRSLGDDGTLLVSWLLPRGWLEKLADEKFVRSSPLASVTRAALRVDVGTRVNATLAMSCDDPALCSDLAEVTKELVEGELIRLSDALPNASHRFGVVPREGAVRLSFWLEEAEAVKLIVRAFHARPER